MSVVEIVLGIAEAISGGLAPVLNSTIRRMRKKRKHHHTVKREQIITRFLNSWVTLQTNIVKLVEALPSLTESSPDRRKVIKELQRTSKILQEANAQLLSCMPIGNALREHEKANYLLQQLESTGYIAELPAVSPRIDPKVSTRDFSYTRERQLTPESPTGSHRAGAGVGDNSSTHEPIPQQTRSLEDEEVFDNSSRPLTRTVTTTHTVYENPPRNVPLQVNISRRGNGPYYNVGGNYSNSTPVLRSSAHHSPDILHAQMGPSHSQNSVNVCHAENPGKHSSASQRDQMNRRW
ncbi:hypothetical protein RUND412_000369 [Rhizina undulata]